MDKETTEAGPLPSVVKGCFVGSGSDGLNEALVCETIIGQTGKAAPVVLYLGTATYDLDGPRTRQTERFGDQVGVMDDLYAVNFFLRG